MNGKAVVFKSIYYPVHRKAHMRIDVRRIQIYGTAQITTLIYIYEVPIVSAQSTIYTDHLNATRIINSGQSRFTSPLPFLVFPPRKISLSLAPLHHHHFSRLSHVKAHTSSTSPPALTNAIVDNSARKSHNLLIRPYPVTCTVRHIYFRSSLSLFSFHLR